MNMENLHSISFCYNTSVWNIFKVYCNENNVTFNAAPDEDPFYSVRKILFFKCLLLYNKMTMMFHFNSFVFK